jgi:DNA-binding NtrC family response regulator
VFPITVPALRERPVDIPLLARHFVAVSAARNNLPLPAVSAEAYAMLQERRWKGNVRELENVMERAVLLAGNDPILPCHVLLESGGQPVPSAPVSSVPPPSGNGSLWEMERELIFKTLARVRENRTHAAKELGISIRTLRNKLREYRGTNCQTSA